MNLDAKAKIIALLILLFAVLCSATISQTATYYIDGVSGNDMNPGTIGNPWKTIDKANRTLTAGDTVYIRGGTYHIGNLVVDGGSVDSQGIAPENSGTNGNPITYRAYPGEKVDFVGIADGTATRAVGIFLDGKNYILVTGDSGYNMTFTNMTANLRIGYNSAGRYNEIAHVDFGTFSSSIDPAIVNYRGMTIQHGSQYNHLHDNRIHDWQYYTTDWDGPVCLEVGEEEVDSSTYFNVIENNIFYHCGHHVAGLQGKYNVFRNNILHNENHFNINGTLYGYRNFLTNGDMATTGSHLIEKNRFGASGISRMSEYLDGRAGRSTQRGGTSFYLNSSHNIIRYNDIYNALGMAMNIRNYGTNQVKYNQIYNNTFYNSGYSTEDDINCDERFPLHLSLNGNYVYFNTIKNNLFHSTWPQTTNPPSQDGCGTRPVTPVIYGDPANQTIASNLEATGAASSHFTNPDDSNAMSETLPDLSLISTSSAVDGGSYLTTADGPGSSSTRLVVVDARYFQDGNFGQGTLAWPATVNMQPDWVAIGSVENAVQIGSINYNTNTITLSFPMTWADKAPIWLYKKSDGVRVLYGTNADMGAHEFIQTAPVDTTPPGAPSGLRVN